MRLCVIALCLFTTYLAYAADDPLRPQPGTCDHSYTQPLESMLEAPAIRITPVTADSAQKLKVMSSVASDVDYYFFYRGTHPHFARELELDVLRDTFRTIDVVADPSLWVEDPSPSLGHQRGYCYFARAVQVGDAGDPTTWTYSDPSNTVCIWRYELVSPPGLTHWNQVVIPFRNPDGTDDSLHGWAERLPGASEIDEWSPTTQTFQMRLMKGIACWCPPPRTGRRTKYGVPYMVTGRTIRGTFAVWGEVLPDTCIDLLSNASLTDYNNIAVQPAFHWTNLDSSSNFRDLGILLYNGTPSNDHGVREILEWSPRTQVWSSRSIWSGTEWDSRPGLKVYQPLMLRRPFENIPGGGTGTPCWPPDGR